MAKDPAFLFYSSDFLTGTMFMNNEQVGKYIKLLCAQHQKGRLTERDMLNICGSYDEDIFCKFTKDSDGKYFNERCEDEINKRKSYSESRRNNRKSTNNQKVKQEKISKSYVKHMENENVNINEIKDIIDYLNITCKTNFKYSKNSTKHINARLNDGFSPDELKDVIEFKFKQWGNDSKMSEYLRPETLFGSKFESYLNASKVKISSNVIDLTRIDLSGY